MNKILYYSTNGKAPQVTFGKALINGIAPDGGLYMPATIPHFTIDEIGSFSGMSYSEVAYKVLWKYLEGEISRSELECFTEAIYNFPVPVESVCNNSHILRLDRGPTASFKDFAAGFMGKIINYYLEKQKQDIVILTATSGDTGSAIARAFYGIERVRVVLLFPRNEVSELQRKQMTTLGGNITAIAVKGKFDDCQFFVKKAFADSQLKSLRLTSANSINIGRLLPQSVYYFYGYSRLAKGQEPAVFSIPSGNFGNMFGGLLAREMGLPVRKFIISVNGNDEFPLFLRNGIYNKIEPSRNCISNAMNVGHPSNLARVVDLYGGNMDETGNLLRSPDMERIHRDIESYSVSDDATKDTMRKLYREHRILTEPHGSVAWKGLLNYISNNRVPDDQLNIVLETAHPAKFPVAVNDTTGLAPVIPESLNNISNKREYYIEIPSVYSRFIEILKAEL